MKSNEFPTHVFVRYAFSFFSVLSRLNEHDPGGPHPRKMKVNGAERHNYAVEDGFNHVLSW